MSKIISQMKKDVENCFIEGQCNCRACVDDRLKSIIKKYDNDISKSLMRLGMTKKPRLFDLTQPPLNLPKVGWASLFSGNNNNSYSNANFSKRLAQYSYYLTEMLNVIAANKGIHRKGKYYCQLCGRLHPNSDKIDGWVPTRTPDSGFEAVPVGTGSLRANKFTICQYCADNYFEQCIDCGDYVSSQSMHHKKIFDGVKYQTKTLCIKCIYNKYNSCVACSMLLKDGIGIDIQARYSDMSFTQYGNRPSIMVCNDHCLKQVIGTCAVCGKHDLKQNMKRHSTEANPYAQICGECYAELNVINSYSYKPAPNFHHVNTQRYRSDRLYYGVEWEINVKSDFDSEKKKKGADLIKMADKKFLYIKSDSSIDRGFEMVTHPFTWEWFKTNRELFKRMCTYMTENGMYPNTSTGIHVHMSRDAFNTFQLYKFIKMIYNPKHRTFMTDYVAHRQSSYARYAEDDWNHAARMSKDKINLSQVRNSAINLTSGDRQPTIELRIFASTTAYDRFSSYIEFLQSMYEYTADCTMNMVNLTDYKSFLNNTNRFRSITHQINDYFKEIS